MLYDTLRAVQPKRHFLNVVIFMTMVNVVTFFKICESFGCPLRIFEQLLVEKKRGMLDCNHTA